MNGQAQKAERNTSPEGPRYPSIEVQLSGQDGNAFAMLGKMTQALRRAGVSHEERAEFTGAAMAGDYDNLLATCMAWVTVL